MYKLKIIFLLVLFFSKQHCNSQSLEFENFTTKNGLLSDDVYKIYQDKKGYIWLFTNNGAMKYNGNRFEQVLKNLPFEESFMYSYYENSIGRKWVANSNAKIYEIVNDSAVQVPGIEELSDLLKTKVAEVTQLCVDEKDNIYINTKYGAFKLVGKEGYKWYNFNTNNKDDKTTVFIQDFDNTIFSGLNYFSFGLIHKESRPSEFEIKYLKKEGGTRTFKFSYDNNHQLMPLNFSRYDGSIYFSFNEKVYKIDKDEKISMFNVKGYILNLCVDAKKQLWVATLNNGLFLFDMNGKLLAHYFEGKTVNHVLADTQNGLWVTTDGFGIFHCKSIDEIHFNENEPLGNSVNFLKKIDSLLFIGTSSGEIDIVSPGKEELLKIPTEKRLFVQDIVKYKTGFITCNRYANLNLLTIDGKIGRSTLPLIKPAFFPLLMYNLGGDSLLCMARRSILILNHGLKDLENKRNNIVFMFDKKIFSFELRGNEKLVGTDDGVYLFRNGSISMPGYLNATKSTDIVAIVKDNDGNYWFCSKGAGLFKLAASNKLMNYTIQQGLPSNIINHISFTLKNEVFLSTNKGLFYSKTTDLKKWIELYAGQVNFTEMLNDKIYCGTKKGLVIINKDREFEDRKIYFHLAKVLVNSDYASLKELNKLTHNRNSIDFYFDAISFSKNFYDIKYTLLGPQNYSGVSSNHQIGFRKLQPGKYYLTAVLLDQNRIADRISVEFNIIPAIWQTFWFQVVIFLSFIFIISLVVWLLFKRYKHRIDKKNEINRLIIEYKLIALKAQINPHFMSNCLTAIQHLILSNKVNEANKYLAKFSFLVRSVMQYSSKALVSLVEELQITRLNIELEQLRFENKFVFETNIDESIDLKEYCIPPLILQPIVENSIWHGLLPLKNKRIGKLQIGVEVFSDFLHVTITDNGVGRQIKKKDISNLRESKGIEITKQRITNLNNYYNFKKADLIYEDLLDENEEPAGTRVTIVLPIIKKDQSE